MFSLLVPKIAKLVKSITKLVEIDNLGSFS